MNHRLIPLAILALTLAGCSQKIEPTQKPDLRDITVTVSSVADVLSNGTEVLYTTDTRSGKAEIQNGQFTASVAAADETITVTIGDGKTVSATQSKYFLDPEKDFKAGMSASGSAQIGDNDAAVTLDPKTSGLKIRFYDSKYYAVDETVKSVCFESDKYPVAGTDTKVEMTWKGDSDRESMPKVGKENAAQYGMILTAMETTLSGKFTVVTDRYTYTFTKSSVKVSKGQITEVVLDFANPDTQPTRIVGILGDSISTFAGYIDPSYSAFYPASDAVSAGGTGTVQSVDKTYWWKLVTEKMQHGKLDNGVSNSYSGTKVVTEGGVRGFVDRAYAFKDPDIIVIHGGTNDMNQLSPMGSFDWDLPIGQLNDGCYRSAYIKLIKMLQNRYPGVQIILVVGDRLSYYEINGPDKSYDYATSTIKIAQHFGLPYVDFTAGGTSYNSLPKSKGSHPNATGHQQMADKIYSTCIDYLP